MLKVIINLLFGLFYPWFMLLVKKERKLKWLRFILSSKRKSLLKHGIGAVVLWCMRLCIIEAIRCWGYMMMRLCDVEAMCFWGYVSSGLCAVEVVFSKSTQFHTVTNKAIVCTHPYQTRSSWDTVEVPLIPFLVAS